MGKFGASSLSYVRETSAQAGQQSCADTIRIFLTRGLVINRSRVIADTDDVVKSAWHSTHRCAVSGDWW